MLARLRAAESIRANHPDEVILDGGPSRSKALDRETMDQLEQLLGGMSGVRRYARSRGANVVTFMEAEWVASTLGVHYVSVNAGISRVWSWETIVRVTPHKRYAEIELASGARHQLSMNKLAAASLTAIAAQQFALSTGDPGQV